MPIKSRGSNHGHMTRSEAGKKGAEARWGHHHWTNTPQNDTRNHRATSSRSETSRRTPETHWGSGREEESYNQGRSFYRGGEENGRGSNRSLWESERKEEQYLRSRGQRSPETRRESEETRQNYREGRRYNPESTWEAEEQAWQNYGETNEHSLPYRHSSRTQQRRGSEDEEDRLQQGYEKDELATERRRRYSSRHNY